MPSRRFRAFLFVSYQRACSDFGGCIQTASTRPDADYIGFRSSHSYGNGRQRLCMFLLSTVFSFRERGNSHTRFSERYFCSLLPFHEKRILFILENILHISPFIIYIQLHLTLREVKYNCFFLRDKGLLSLYGRLPRNRTFPFVFSSKYRWDNIRLNNIT